MFLFHTYYFSRKNIYIYIYIFQMNLLSYSNLYFSFKYMSCSAHIDYFVRKNDLLIKVEIFVRQLIYTDFDEKWCSRSERPVLGEQVSRRPGAACALRRQIAWGQYHHHHHHHHCNQIYIKPRWSNRDSRGPHHSWNNKGAHKGHNANE